ncbi:MAG: B12-binding domain-containing radical SAM protein [Euryarchaeota archaeon]|nr:B12-binding domain-containing radical SAM protein [Euryarchaeota archaeon]
MTADRTLISEYGGSIFLGFSSVVPESLVPQAIYFGVFCPPVHARPDGSLPVSPCGTRKIEATLLDAGFTKDDVIVAHPEHLSKVIGPDTKILGITENDPLGIGPATSTFTGIFGGDAYMKIKFRELLNDPVVKKYHPHIVVGGPGAWQLTQESTRKELGIDTVLVGEGEMVVPDLFRRILADEDVPGMVMGEVTPIERIAKVREAAVDGLVEIARGCGRGCEFCIPTMAKYRCRTIDDIVEDVKTTVRCGRQPILHSEDVVRYGASGVAVNEEKLVSLFKAVKAVEGVERISISHFALSSVASAPEAIKEISEIMGLTEENWLGGQTGIESGSAELMHRYMIGKCKPFAPEQWQDTVVSGFKICKENHWVPCGTIIMGLPGEKEEDIRATIELVKKLREFRSLIVPLFFVATGEFVNGERSFGAKDMTKAHTELFLDCWEHNLDWAHKLMGQWGGRSVKNPLGRIAIDVILRFGIIESKEVARMCRKEYDYDVQKMMTDAADGKIRMFPLTVKAFANLESK